MHHASARACCCCALEGISKFLNLSRCGRFRFWLAHAIRGSFHSLARCTTPEPTSLEKASVVKKKGVLTRGKKPKWNFLHRAARSTDQKWLLRSKYRTFDLWTFPPRILPAVCLTTQKRRHKLTVSALRPLPL